MFASIKYVAEQAIILRLKESLKYESKGYKYRIKFENDITIDKKRNKDDRIRLYKIIQWNKRGEY